MGRVKRRTQKKTSLKRRNKSSRRRSITKVKSKEPGKGGWGGQKKRIKKSTKQTGGGWGSPKVYTPEMVGGWGGSNESNQEEKIPLPKTTRSKYGRNFNLSILKQSGGWGGASRTVYDVNTGKTSLVRKYFKKHFH